MEAAAGANMRDSLIKAGVQVYKVQSGRFTNCNGKQLCGTCIVDVVEGAEYTNAKSLDESSYLRKMPERLLPLTSHPQDSQLNPSSLSWPPSCSILYPLRIAPTTCDFLCANAEVNVSR